jgi:hypothetical protein
MTKISKLILGAGALGVLGIAALPFTSYAATDALLQVNINETISDNCGNAASGCSWFISDKDGGTPNLGIAGGAVGVSSGGFVPITTKVAKSVGITTANQYGFTAYYTNLEGTANGGVLFSDGQLTAAASSNYYGKDLLVGAGATGAGSITSSSFSPVALSTSGAGTVSVSVPQLTTADGSAAGGTGSWYKYNTALGNGTYENTLTVTTVQN